MEELNLSNIQIPFGFSISDDDYKLYFQSPLESSVYNLLDGAIFNPVLSSFSMFYTLLGCIGKFKKITMSPEEIYELDLSPEIGDGLLLYINYTPCGGGGLFPIEMHSNTPIRHEEFKKKYLYPGKNKSASNVKETEIQIFYWYLPAGLEKDDPRKLMLDAFKCFYEEKFSYMIISAQTALEIMQYNFFSKILSSVGISEENKRNFLSRTVTFALQFKVLLPLITNFTDIPAIPSSVASGISRLINVRNNLIHTRNKKIDLERSDAKTMLISSYLLYKYYQIYSPK